MDAAEQYEALAEAFYAETRVMAPGKDMSAAMGDYGAYDLRVKLWNLWRKTRTPLPAAAPVVVNAAGPWHEGAPPHPWDTEWFLAQTKYGDYTVLRPLSEEWTYDYTTADNTYLMRDRIERWAQLSSSEYKVYPIVEVPADA